MSGRGCTPATTPRRWCPPGGPAKVIGVAAKAAKGTAGEVVTLTGYAAGVAAFGEDAADRRG